MVLQHSENLDLCARPGRPAAAVAVRWSRRSGSLAEGSVVFVRTRKFYTWTFTPKVTKAWVVKSKWSEDLKMGANAISYELQKWKLSARIVIFRYSSLTHTASKMKTKWRTGYRSNFKIWKRWRWGQSPMPRRSRWPGRRGRGEGWWGRMTGA